MDHNECPNECGRVVHTSTQDQKDLRELLSLIPILVMILFGLLTVMLAFRS